MRILCDVDGVLADFVSMALPLVAAFGGSPNLDSWDFTDSVPAEARDHFWRAIGAKGVCASLKPLPGASEFVGDLRELGHEVLFVTSPIMSSGSWMHERTAWLQKLVGARYKDVIHCHRKDVVRGDVLIDDAPKNVTAWSAAWPDGTALLLDMPFNRTVEAGTRVHSYEEACEVIAALAEMSP